MKHIIASRPTALLTALLVAVALATPRADILEQVLVKVNGDIITKTDLEQRQIMVLRQQQPNLRPDDQAEVQKALSAITPQVIVEAVDELLIVQRGRELGYAMSTEQFNSIVENIKKENKLETEEAFQNALKGEGMTMADLRKQLERQMIITRVQQSEVMSKLQVTDAELKMHYDTNKGKFTSEPQYTLREVLVAVAQTDRGVSVAADDDAKAKAEDIRKRLLGGEPFARIAADSSDSPSKANGGLIGPISRDVLSPELQKEIDGLKPGELTAVLRTPRGYQILKLETVEGANLKPFEEAKDDISESIANEKRKGEFDKFMTRLRGEAIIDWKNDEIKRAYEVGLAKPSASS